MIGEISAVGIDAEDIFLYETNMGERNDLRKEMMRIPMDGSVMTGEDVADYLTDQTTGW
ncbi:MAG: hypothetical protein ACYC9J_11590 [Sulfuricaulis sp.]